ncbi:hypothetical protein [Candidatus Methanomethylophilus sp. 1R26]|uniref:hypothetical protein n=1 Tax=Candidatus Methanomethylophilus sp. 1R26 TaxID=1769296 RepID=UPI00190FCA84|nr:hypothetical protein [Candidatus Methanomethylophilus sp. 1R26]
MPSSDSLLCTVRFPTPISDAASSIVHLPEGRISMTALYMSLENPPCADIPDRRDSISGSR